MSETSSPPSVSNFTLQIGDSEIPQAVSVNLPPAKIQVIESWTDHPYPIKQAEPSEFGGSFTMELYAQAASTPIDQWWDSTTTYPDDENMHTVTVTLHDEEGDDLIDWEFSDAVLESYEYGDTIGEDDDDRVVITIGYDDVQRTSH